jgi:anti-anti-sigma factor
VNIRTETLAGHVLVIPSGRVDFSSAAGFQAQLEQAVADAHVPAAVIVDCAALEYVSSAGLRAFLLAARAAQRAGIMFLLCALQPAVRDVFDLSGFSRVIPVKPDRAAALAQAVAGPA